MLISENLIELIKIHLQLQKVVGSQSFAMGSNHNLILRDKRRQNRDLFKALFGSIDAFWYCVQLLIYWDQAPLVLSLQTLLFVIAVTVFCITKWTVYNRQRNIVELFNLFVRFEKRQSTGTLSFLFKLMPLKKLGRRFASNM